MSKPAKHTATRLLHGWAEISAYVGKSDRVLSRYVKSGFPAIRFGKTLVSSPALIDEWLMAFHLARLQAKRAKAEGGSNRSPTTTDPKDSQGA